MESMQLHWYLVAHGLNGGVVITCILIVRTHLIVKGGGTNYFRCNTQPEAPTLWAAQLAAQVPTQKLFASPPPNSEPLPRPQLGDHHVSNVKAPFYNRHNRTNP